MTGTVKLIKTTLPGSWKEFEVNIFSQSLLSAGAACVSHSSVVSMYNWDGKVVSENEWALEVKVSAMLVDKIVEQISESHPYDVPQILIGDYTTSKGYFDWVENCFNGK